MAETAFGVKYEGPVLMDGRMAVADLAPALLALGDLFVEASRAAYPEQEPVTLDIKATDSGSFLIYLALHSPDTWDQIIHFFSSPTADALNNIKELVIGSGIGLFVLIKRLRGRRIHTVERLESGQVRLTLDDTTTLEVPAEALALYQNLEVRKKIRRVVEPLEREGVSSVGFIENHETTVTITEADLSDYEVPEPEEELLTDYEIETVVAITSLTFIEGNKWRFTDGGNAFAAAIEDPDFLDRIEHGEPFRKGDMLKVRMRIVQSKRDGTLHSEYHILHVVEHVPRGVQLEMGDDLGLG